MMRRLRGWSLAFAVLVVVLSAASAAGGTAGPRTLVASNRPLWAIAQSSAALAWIGDDGRVQMERFGGGKASVIGALDRPEASRSAVMAVAGTRALWAFDTSGNNYEMSVDAGGLGLKSTGVAGLQGSPRGYGDGTRFAGLAGDASTLAFGKVDETCVGVPFNLCEDLCNPIGSCPLTVTGGGVSILTPSLKPAQVPALPPPALFALAGNFLAIAPARSPVANIEPVPRVVEDGPVEVYDRSGGLLARIPLQGLVRGLAMTGHKLTVLLEHPDGSRGIIRFDARTGAGLSGSPLLSPAAASLSTGTGGIVFRVGRQIYLLRGRTPLPIVRAASTPIGLSIVGKRIVWGENVNGHGRIRELTVR
jgi:hypothetical protein